MKLKKLFFLHFFVSSLKDVLLSNIFYIPGVRGKLFFRNWTDYKRRQHLTKNRFGLDAVGLFFLSLFSNFRRLFPTQFSHTYTYRHRIWVDIFLYIRKLEIFERFVRENELCETFGSSFICCCFPLLPTFFLSFFLRKELKDGAVLFSL